MKKGFALPVVLVGIIVVVVAGVIIYFLKTIFDLPGYPPQQPLQISQATPPAQQSSPTTDETADWKTYTSKDLGFSIKYPSNWEEPTEITETTTILSGNYNNSGDIAVEIDKEMEADSFYGDLSEMEINKTVPRVGSPTTNTDTRLPNTTVDGYTGLVLLSTLKTKNSLDYNVFVKRGGYTYRLIVSGNEEKQQELKVFFQTVASTFKFLD